MKEIKEIKTRTYSVEHYIDIVETEDMYEAWLYSPGYGIKMFMIGCPKKQQSYETFLEYVENEIGTDLELYYEDINKLESMD